MTGCPVIDFADPKIQRDPFPAYEALRAKGPVHRDPTTGYYVVVDYDLNLEIVRDVETYSNETGVIAVRSGDFGKEIQKVYEEHGVPVQPTLLVTDPPRHRFYRSFVDRAFSPSRVKKLEAYLTEVCDEMIAEFANESEIDFIARMAAILPVYVVADLVGADRSMVSSLKLWADAAASGTDPSSPREAVLFDALARPVIGSVEVFDPNTASSPSTASACWVIFAFSSSFSNRPTAIGHSPQTRC